MTWIPTAKQAREEAEKYYLSSVTDCVYELLDLLQLISAQSRRGKRKLDCGWRAES